jgi:succinate dehydrogenase / fumarate reductase, cytochrome b subunit
MAQAQERQRRVGNTPFWPRHYHAGMWAFVLHRISGLVLVGYLFLHIWVISSVTVSGGTFDEAMRIFQTPVFTSLDVGLLAAFAFHGLNGLRIILFDIGFGTRQQKPLFYGAFVVATLITIFAFVEVLPYVTGRPLA